MSAIMGNKSELTRQDNAIRQALDAQRGVLHASKAHFARRLGMSEDTFNRRYKNPEDFTLGELRKLCAAMEWECETAGEVLFG